MIVGGGVAGLGLATALAKRGISSTVVEQRKETGDIDRGDVLHSGARQILERWQLLGEVAARRALRFSRFSIIDNDGRRLLGIDVSKEFGEDACFTSLRHPFIEDILEAASRRSGLVDIRRGVRCSALVQENGRVIGVRIGGREQHAPLTVLATGANTKLVDAHFGKGDRYDYGVSFFNVRLRCRTPVEPEGHYVVGRRGVAVVVPLPDNEMRIGLQFHHGRDEPSGTRQMALARFEGVIPKSILGDADVIDVQTYRLAKLWHHRMDRPGIVVIGDAAHRVHPIGGQGMNLGLADGELLAGHLHDAHPDAAILDKACQRFSAERQRQLAPIRRQIHMLGLIGSVEQSWFTATRSILIRVLDHVVPAKRYIIKRFLEGNLDL